MHRHHGEKWLCLPGGAVEAGETPAEAAIHELKGERWTSLNKPVSDRAAPGARTRYCLKVAPYSDAGLGYGDASSDTPEQHYVTS